MITPTQDTALDRWDTLPLNLREALCSEPNSDFVWKTSSDEHIPYEKIYDVAKVAGYVLMGFLHPEDVAQELKERLGIDIRTANTIEDALNKRIFIPLRPDIDKVYAPVSKSEVVATVQAPKPTPVANLTMAPSILPPKPSTMSDIGWSKSQPSPSPVVKLSASSLPPSVPAATSAAASGAAGEFERLKNMSKTPTPGGAPTEPPPMIIHEDTTFKAGEKNASFTLSKPGGGAEMQMGSERTQAPLRPAVLELGKTNAPSATTTPASGGVVHYTEFRPSLSSVPTTSTGPRNISQITPPSVPAAAPARPIAPAPASSIPVPIPRPPMAPPRTVQAPFPMPIAPRATQAPQPPQAEKEKVITKNFL